MYRPVMQYLSTNHVPLFQQGVNNGQNIFVFDEVLGSGGFGTVLKCHKVSDNANFAIKIDTGKRNIAKECDILKILRGLSENIVDLHDFGQYWIVMELCHYDLRKMLRAKGSLDENTIRVLFKQVAVAFNVIHKKGIIHGDIKPDNILLSKKSDRLVVKIADFGCASIFSANSFCGTPAYMAPEMFNALFHCGTEIDLWCIGATMYECFYGVRPIQGYTFLENPLWTPPIAMNGLQPSESLRELLCKLLKLIPTERMSLEEFTCHPFFSDAVGSYNVPLPSYNQRQPLVPNRHPHTVVPGFTLANRNNQL